MATITEVVELIPDCRKLKSHTRNELFKILESRVARLTHKLRLSPYQPHQKDDPLGVTARFEDGLCKWLQQLPEEHRLASLAVALSLQYVTETEFDLLLDIATERLTETLAEKEGLSHNPLGPSLSPGLARKTRAYAVSTFASYGRFVHRSGIGSTKDGDVRPAGTLLDDFLRTTFAELRSLADFGRNFHYSQRAIDNVSRAILSLAASYIVVVEDCSLSGGTILSDLKRLLIMLSVLFPAPAGRQAPRLDPPSVYVVTAFATKKALETIESVADTTLRTYFPSAAFTGYVFQENERSATSLPDSMRDFQHVLSTENIKLFSKLRNALEFYHDRYSHFYYTEDTQISSRTSITREDFIFGFKKGAWTILTNANCPNNSLPIIWYPHTDAPPRGISALFPRVESRTSHESPSAQVDDNIVVVREDRQHFLNEIIRDLHETAL